MLTFISCHSNCVSLWYNTIESVYGEGIRENTEGPENSSSMELSGTCSFTEGVAMTDKRPSPSRMLESL